MARGIVKGGLNDGGSNIKGIQRGVYAVLGTDATINITISPVDLTKSIVRIRNNATTGNSNSDNFRCELITSTNLQITRVNATSTTPLYWEVVEFNNVKSLQNGNVVLSTTPQTVSISPINPNKSMLFVSFTNPYSNSTYGESFAFLACGITNATTLTFEGQLASTSNYTVTWYLIEFN